MTNNKKTSMELIEALVKVLNKENLTELEVSFGDVKAKVTRALAQANNNEAQANNTLAQSNSPHAQADSSGVTNSSGNPQSSSSSASSPGVSKAEGTTIKSPMVGTVYIAPEPEAQPFVTVGSKVSVGQTLFIIEAMKTMNPIQSTVAGTVTSIVINDSQAVEFGEPLAVIG